MTHEELLNRINEDERLSHLYGHSCHQRLLKYFNSLRAVVELHKPEFLDERGDVCLTCCPDLLTLYPCPTIQAIEKELVRKSELWQDLTEKERIEVIAKNIKDLNNYK